MYLTVNQLTEIPAELGNLRHLESLEMQLNPLRGTIPPELGNLANLRTLNLSWNPGLEGRIPPELGNLESLESLELWSNALTGPIPPELGKLLNLKELHIQRNQLEGPLPPELGGLENLEAMDLGLNDLTGAIPEEIAGLVSLESLWLRGNRLTSIAGGLGGMQRLAILDLRENRLTERGLPPGVFAGLPSLQSLDLGGNQLHELPAGMFVGLGRLGHLSLAGNPGAPFTLTLQSRRVDRDNPAAPGPASVEIRLPEGAPVDLRVPLSVRGGTISANEAILNTGSDRSAPVTVASAAGSQNGTEVITGPVPGLPRSVSGIRLEMAGSLVLFGDVSNRGPIPERRLPWMRMRVGDQPRGITLSTYFRDPDKDELEFSATSDDPGIVSTSTVADRLTVTPLKSGSALLTVTATDAGGLTAESSFPVTVRRVREGSFAIALVMVDPPSKSLEAVLDDAVEYWESILADTEFPDIPVGTGVPLGCRGISAEQSLEVIDDIAMVVAVGYIDGLGGVAGRVSICAMRDEPRVPLIGTLQLDAADMERLQGHDVLEELVLHEIGHVLGIGSAWTLRTGLIDRSLDNRGADTHFKGPLAIAAFDDAGGDIYSGGNKVPVENFRGGRDSHWRESVLDRELMTPLLSAGVPNPLSAISIQSLADLGYIVDLSLAEPFRVPGAEARAPDAVELKIDIGEDILQGPITVYDRSGRVVRVIPN